MAIGEKSYIVGRGSRFFWPGAVMLGIMMLWSVMSAELYPALIEHVVIEDQTAHWIAGVQTFLHTAALVSIMAFYGLRNKVKAFRFMFLLLGGLYIASAYGHYISNYYVSYILSFHGRLTPAMLFIVGAVALILQAAWIAFAVIILCQRRAGGVLRASAVVMLLAQLAMAAYRYGYAALYQWLSMRYGTPDTTTLTWFIGALMVLAAYVPILFLLGAMSFSRMKVDPDRKEQEEPTFPQV